jgi:hypothetical protein
VGPQGTQGPTGFIENINNTLTISPKVRISSIYVQGSATPGTTSNYESISGYYYNNDIEYDAYNRLTTLFRFSEKIHDNGSPTTATSGGPWHIDTNNGTLQYLDLASAATGTTKYFSFSENISNETSYSSSLSFILLIRNPPETLTINWPSNVKWEVDLGAPSIGGGTGTMTVIPFTYLFGSVLDAGVSGWVGGADLKYNI